MKKRIKLSIIACVIVVNLHAIEKPITTNTTTQDITVSSNSTLDSYQINHKINITSNSFWMPGKLSINNSILGNGASFGNNSSVNISNSWIDGASLDGVTQITNSDIKGNSTLNINLSLIIDSSSIESGTNFIIGSNALIDSLTLNNITANNFNITDNSFRGANINITGGSKIESDFNLSNSSIVLSEGSSLKGEIKVNNLDVNNASISEGSSLNINNNLVLNAANIGNSTTITTNNLNISNTTLSDSVNLKVNGTLEIGENTSLAGKLESNDFKASNMKLENVQIKADKYYLTNVEIASKLEAKTQGAKPTINVKDALTINNQKELTEISTLENTDKYSLISLNLLSNTTINTLNNAATKTKEFNISGTANAKTEVKIDDFGKNFQASNVSFTNAKFDTNTSKQLIFENASLNNSEINANSSEVNFNNIKDINNTTISSNKLLLGIHSSGNVKDFISNNSTYKVLSQHNNNYNNNGNLSISKGVFTNANLIAVNKSSYFSIYGGTFNNVNIDNEGGYLGLQITNNKIYGGFVYGDKIDINGNISKNLDKFFISEYLGSPRTQEINTEKERYLIGLQTAEGVIINDMNLEHVIFKDNANLNVNQTTLKNITHNGLITTNSINIDKADGSGKIISQSIAGVDSFNDLSGNLELDVRNAKITNSTLGTSIIDKIDAASSNVTFNGKLTTKNDLNADNFIFKNDVDVIGAKFSATKDTGFKNVKANDLEINYLSKTMLNGTLTSNTMKLNNVLTNNQAINVENELNANNSEFNIINFGANANLITNNSIYNESISLNTFDKTNKSNIFKKDFSVKNSTIYADNNTFLGNVNSDNGDFISTKHSGYLNVSANNINLNYANTTILKGTLNAKNNLRVNNVNTSFKVDVGNNLSSNNSVFNTQIDVKGILDTLNSTYNEITNIGDFAANSKGNIFNKTINSAKDIYADDNAFLDLIKAGGTLYASKSNHFKNIDVNNISFVGNGLIELDNHDLKVNGSAIIDGMRVNAYNFLMNNAEIKNTDTMAYLLGNKENPIYNPSEIYKPNVISGSYSVDNISNKGGIRANNFISNNSHLVGQFVANNLTSFNTNYYLLGGGIDTTLYESFSGAVIARNSGNGANNNIRIKDTNILGLTKGLVPVAIIKEDANTRAILGKDYFTLSYVRGTNLYSFNANMEHYKTYETADGKYHAWLIGSTINGDEMGELTEDNIKGVADGTDDSFNAAIVANGNANEGTSPKDTNANLVYNDIKNTTSSDVILKYDDEAGIIFEGLDNEQGEAIDNIIHNDEHIARIIQDANKQRLAGLRNLNHGLGFWYYAYNGRAYANSSVLKYKGLNFGIDKKIENKNNDLYFGLLANTLQANVSKNLEAVADVKTGGIYATALFHNGAYIDFTLAYSGIKNDISENAFKAINSSSYMILGNTSIGYKYGNKVYVEPSISLNASYLPSYTMNRDITEVRKYSKTLLSMQPSIAFGYNDEKLDIFTQVGLEKDLTKSSYYEIEDDYIIVQKYGKKDFRLRTTLGIGYNPTKNTNIQLDYSKDFNGNFVNDYKINLGVRHNFN